MTPWQRRARIVAAMIGLACVAAVYVYSRGRPTPTPPAPPAQLSDPQATSEASRGNLIRFDATGGKNGYTLEFVHAATYPDGHSRYETVTLTTKREGRQIDIKADVAEEKGKAVTGDNPGQVVLTGHVRVATSDGLQFQTDAATYDDALGIVQAPGRVSFTRGRLTGDGLGATYDRQRDFLSLLDQAHVVMAPDNTGSGAIDAMARLMDLAKADKYIRLTDHAKIARDRETLASDTALIHLTDDEHGVTLIELRGHASVMPHAGVANGPPEMRADAVTLGFHPDGHTLQRSALAGGASLVLTNETGRRTITGSSINIVLAPDGQTLTQLDGANPVTVDLPASADVPARTIRAQALVAQGDDKHGLTVARFDGGAGFVDFTETPPATPGQPATRRVAKSKVLALKLSGQLDAIDEAEFLQQVIFTDGDVKAVASRATYFATKGELNLWSPEGAGQASPQVVEGSVTINGHAVKLNTVSHDLDADGDANSSMLPSTETGANHAPGLFEPGKLVLGTAPKLSYSSAAQEATYLGTVETPARVWQDQTQNLVMADTIVLEQGSGNLTATAHVHSTLILDDAPSGGATTKAAAPGPVAKTASANAMRYVDDQRKVSYSGDPGAPAILKGADDTITAQQIDVYLAQATRTLDHLVADGAVHNLQSVGGREARGDHMTYDATTDRYTIQGQPAQAKLPSSDGKGCSLHTGTDLAFTPSGTVTASAHGAPVTEREWPCTDPIPVKK